MKNCLLVIDMQNDFITGSLYNEEGKKIVSAVKKRIEKAFAENEDVIFTKDTHKPNYLETREGKFLPVEHCIKGTKGHDICDELKPFEKKAKLVLEKETFGCKDLPPYLSDYDNITIIGLCTDICVISNALLVHAFYPEKNITIEKSCCAGTTIENHNNALSAMKICHINIA